MSTITREQLIEKLQYRIAVTANYPDIEEAQLDAAIFKIALAALDAKAVAWIVHARTGDQLTADGDYVANAEGILGLHSTPLYAAPQQAPVVVDEIAEQAGIDPDIADAYMQGVNDTNQRKLADIIPSVIPEGLTGQIVYLCAFDNMPRHELATRIWNACRDAIVHAELSIRKDCPWCNGEGYVDIDHGFEMGVEQKECRHCRAAMLNHIEDNLGMVKPVTTSYKLPMQPLVIDAHGTLRFKENPIVRKLLDFSIEHGYGLNEMALENFTPDDRMQLAQLIGYSLAGYGTLSYVTDASYARAAGASPSSWQAMVAAAPKLGVENG